MVLEPTLAATLMGAAIGFVGGMAALWLARLGEDKQVEYTPDDLAAVGRLLADVLNRRDAAIGHDDHAATLRYSVAAEVIAEILGRLRA